MAINDPVPSTAFDVLQRNVQDVDRYLNTSAVFNNRVGLPVKPIPMQAAEWQTAIGSVGWFPVGGDFSTGATLTARNQVIYDPASTAWYSWGGALPKTVPAASSPTSTGGISAGAWTMRSDAALATALNNGTALINGLPASVLVNVLPVDNLKDLSPIGGYVFNVGSFYAGRIGGGGRFIYDPNMPKSRNNGGTIIAPEALQAWDGTVAGIGALFAWSGSGSGCFVRQTDSPETSPLMFGATNGEFDDVAQVNQCFNAAAPVGFVCMPPYVKLISGPLLFRNGVVVRGPCFVLNYSNGDACQIHPSDGIIRSKVSGIHVRYRDYMTPLNPYSPPFYIDRNARLGNNIRWTHLDSFTGDGFKHSTSGRFFLDLQESTCYGHRYGTHVLGWTVKLTGVRCDFNLIGHYGSDASIDGVRYPVHNLTFDACHAVNNTLYGAKVSYADGVDFGDLHVERNGVNNLFIEGLRGYSSGCMYLEYAKEGIYSFNNVGGSLNSFNLGQKDEYKKYAKQAQNYYEIVLPSNGAPVTVPAYDSGTQLGINNFASVPKDDVAVIVNETYITPADFSKSGDVITVPSALSGQTLRVIAYAFHVWTPTSTVTNEKYLLGCRTPLLAAHTRDLEFNGFGQSFINSNILVNDFDPNNVPATKNIYFNAQISNTTRADLPQVFYPWGEGFSRRQDFLNGLAFKNAFDANQNTTITTERKYPQVGQVRDYTYANAARCLFIITGDDGSGVFTIDQNGNLSPLTASTNRYTFGTNNAAVNGKLNFYSGQPNTLSFDNRLGFATGYNLMIIRGV